MRIALINPGGGYRHEYPPLGLLYLAAVLKRTGHVVGFYDEGARHKKHISIFDYLKAFKPQISAVALYTTNLSRTYKTIANIKKICPQGIILAGGPHATVLPERTMEECPDIDFLVCGEGEVTVTELLGAFQAKSDISRIAGIYYRSKGDIRHTPPRRMVEDLNSIPFPAYDLLEDFSYNFHHIRVGKKVATMVTSRGCPYECVFCAAKAVWGRSFRRRSPQNVIAEIEWLTEEHGYDEVYFQDDLFAVDRAWLDEFYCLLRQRGIKVPWKCLARVDLLTAEDYTRMANHGCYLIQLGVESGDDTVLKDIKKNITTAQARIAFQQARQAGLNTYGFFILGHRLDTPQTVIRTINFAKNLHPDFVSFFCLVPFPGTEVYNLVPESLKYDWDRIAYSGWGRNLAQIQISAVNPGDLLLLEQQAYVPVHASFSFLLRNILLTASRKKLRLSKLRLVLFYTLAWLKFIFRGRWILGRYEKFDFTNYAQQEAFDSLWQAYIKKSDFKKELEDHLQERKPYLELIKKYISIAGARNIIEIGCGTAIDSHYLSRIYPQLDFKAADYSHHAVAAARKIGESLESRAVVLEDNITSMKFKDSSFDLIFSQGVIEHFRDPVSVYQEQARVLKTSGFFIVSVPQKFNPYTLYKHRRLREGVWEYGWETEYSFGALRKLGAQCGFEVVDVAGCGYGYFQDYGFSIVPFLLQRAKKKNILVVSFIASLFLKLISVPERYFGHYFMRDIIVVYRKK